MRRLPRDGASGAFRVNGTIFRPRQARPFDILGIDEVEENAYRWLLTNPGTTVTDLALALRLSPRKAQRLLDAIEHKGLVTVSPQRPRRYVPASPGLAMEALVLKRLDELQRARAQIQQMQEETAHAGDREQLVELITARETERQVFERMHQTAQAEVLTLVRLPILISPLDVPPEQAQRPHREAQRRGVVFRNIVDSDFLAAPGMAERILGDVRAGEQVRTVPSLPFKMVLADHALAFVPLELNRPDSASLMVRSSALLDALHALFELLWESATPIQVSASGGLALDTAGTELPEPLQAVVSLLAAGLPDKVIARELGISASTLNRRIIEAMALLKADTRFQLGWLAALRLSGRTG